jgi:Nif-specific regulatory protein
MGMKSENGIPYPPESRENEKLQFMLKVSASLYQYLDIDELILHIIGLIKEMMDIEAVSVILHDEKSDEFIFRWVEDERLNAETKLSASRFPRDRGIAGSVFACGNPEIILDVENDSRHYKKIDSETGCQTCSMIAVPLKKKDKKIGVLQVLNKKGGNFDEKDLELLSSIAPIIAMALDNALMYAELQSSYQNLQIMDRLKDDQIKNTQAENLRLREAIESRYKFDRIVGNSECMLEVFRLCEKVINSDITVLIEGETGTGKELIARCIHFNSPRKTKPFVSQNCGGIPDTLLASELFGHKRGAFTGAIADKKGLFESADSGTIFLDEVAEMSPAMQISLLRAIQEGEVKPLGADYHKKVNVRVISATNRHLEDCVKKGTFREDLFYRMNVFTVKLPRLRERTGDIPLLVHHFIRKFNEKHRRHIKGIERDALQCLEAHPFHGNVRELENEIERAVAMAEEGGMIGIDQLSDRIKGALPSLASWIQAKGSLREQVENLEKSILLRKMDEYEGNKSKIARELGLSRYGLAKKMQRYRLKFGSLIFWLLGLYSNVNLIAIS